ncbi:MAG: replication-associated recombination protein A [Acidobacteriota bacterium]|nr:replication-associated recombination protein A [Acidobacteriota bacterium]
MDRGLFDPPETDTPSTHSGPLADRIRPRQLDEIVGQDAVVGEAGFLRRAITADRVPSLLFWGPPGSGKTTIARIIARETSSLFVPFSAVTSGIKDVKGVMADAARLRLAQGTRTLLFIDEIHRFNRAQQDAFLPYVERGDIILIGATTENPSFQVNAALLSRCRVVVLEALGVDELERLMRRALTDSTRGLARFEVAVDSDALAAIAQLASGDARKALNLLELAVEDAAGQGKASVAVGEVTALAQRKVLLYDRSGEEHFNLISALHKSLRESDPDAALYWLARMLAAGEDPLYVARRMIRFASEDIGLADPQALTQALAAWDAYRKLGSPEGELALAQAVIYMALAPKSNSVYSAYGAVRRTIEERPADPVPMAVRNAPTKLMKSVGYGRGHVYAHATNDGMGGMECLPEALAGSRFYQPRDVGFERELASRLDAFRELRARIRSESVDKSSP